VLAHLELRAAVGKNCLPLQQEICQNWLTVQPHDMEKEQSHHSSITKPHVASFSHHYETHSAVESDASPPFWTAQLLSKHSGSKKIGNVCEGMKERQKKEKNKLIYPI